MGSDAATSTIDSEWIAMFNRFCAQYSQRFCINGTSLIASEVMTNVVVAIFKMMLVNEAVDILNSLNVLLRQLHGSRIIRQSIRCSPNDSCSIAAQTVIGT